MKTHKILTTKKIIRVGVYIDGSNIYHGGKEAGWKLSYSKLKTFIERKYSISIMSYYNCTGYLQNKSGKYQKDKNGKYILDPKALRFENMLKGLGVRVFTKPLKFIKGDEKHPANKTDGNLIVDCLLEEKQWDKLLLLAGDCDYESLVKYLISKSKPVHIFSFTTRMSHELKVLAFQSPFVSYTSLENLESLLKYKNFTKLVRKKS